MKSIMLVCLTLLGLHLSAQEWEPFWSEAVKDCSFENFASAESHFNLSIDLMENEKDLEHPYVYTDRARLYMTLNKYEDALADVNKALLSEKLQHSERMKAVSVRIAAKLYLGMPDGCADDLEFLFKNLNSLENLDVCKQSRDISLTIESCRLFCDRSAEAAFFGWCPFFVDQCVVIACNKAVAELQGNCRNCCGVLFSQDICSAPFADIAAVMQKYLPPCGCPK
jgi:hypothetical protein